MTPTPRPERPARTPGRLGPLAAKVPEITALFWLIKILTTGMGESMSDFLGHHSIPLAAAIGILGLSITLRLQLRSPRYHAWTYWLAVMMVAVFGTMAADAIHRGGHVPYSVTTPLFALGLAAVFLLWYRTERTLSIHSITTTRRELFYWTAVLGTFALGTAAGDLTAIELNLGYLESAVLFAVVIALPGIAWARGRLDPITAFWTAYVVTRPLGASIADWLGKSHDGGLGFGDGWVSAIALLVFLGLVAHLARTRRDIQAPTHATSGPPEHARLDTPELAVDAV
jgi:uncharacterized membrane-anchored protein